MPDITMPFGFSELRLKPEPVGRVKISDDIQQTLASIVGYNGSDRSLLRCSGTGVLFACSPRIDGIEHITATSGAFDWNGADKKISEVMIMGHPDNTGLVWVKNDAAALATNGWPLSAKEVLNFSIDNLANLHLLIVTTAEKAIVLWTR